MTDREASNKLMQFLMGLNESYDNLKNQILSMDPWPTVNRAYSMMMQVEKQRQVQMVYSEGSETNALFTRMTQTNSRRGGTSVRIGTGRGNFKRSENWRKGKENQFCSHCNRSGHDRESCFKLNGYPDWFKGLKDQRQGQGMNRITAVNSTETPLDVDTEQDESKNNEVQNNLSNMIQQELMKLMKAKLNMGDNNINFANLEDFAGFIK
ncbi:Hypothetical predicted protein [Olea europaea subsp. europaea]|uniref:Uncharacterized protein n=1 Tax=Olea europaea subsp. europaea TaxID=158383 RepID=A0A8S0QNS7_OLEEU|nr:Hypothetical predicted protein [Olea europaea subsp. europaea]